MTTPPQVHRYVTTDFLSLDHRDEFVEIIDSLGRKWNPLKHPRDSKGRFIRTFSFVTFDMPGGGTASGRVLGIDKDGSLLVKVKGVTPGGPQEVKDKYVKVPHDKVEVRTVKAQLVGKGTHVGVLQKQENKGVSNSIKSLRKQGMNTEADKMAEAQRLANLPPNPRDPKSVADKEKAIELFREVADAVDTERGKGFKDGEDYDEVKANLSSTERAKLQNLDDVTKNTYTARHSLGDKTIDGIETSQGTMSGNQPEVREQAAKTELAKDFADDVEVYDITSGELVEGHLEKPVKAEVRDTVAAPQSEGLPETWRSAYKRLSSGRDRLTGAKQAQQVAPGDRHHVDKNGNQVRVGHVVHVDATKSRPAFDGMVSRIYTDKNGNKHIYARDFDPRGQKGYTTGGKNVLYKDHSVQGGSIELASDDQQSSLFQKLSLEGHDSASKSLVKSFTDEYIKSMQRRYATPGALKTSATAGFFDVTPIHLREKSDANGEKLRIGDAVQGPNGEDGFVSYLEPNANTAKVYWRNGKSSRITSNKLKRQHGATSEVFPGDSGPNTNNYVPTRDEAADIADAKGADTVAKVIREGGDSEAIQAAMVTDPAFQEKLFDIDALYDRRDQTLATGQGDLSDEDKAELGDWDRMLMASAGYFRDDDAPPPEAPSAPTPDPAMEGDAPQNPGNPTEKITPEGVTVREEDGNVVVNDNTEDPISANDQQAIDQAVADAAGTPDTQGAPNAPTPKADLQQPDAGAPPLAEKLNDDVGRLVDEAKQGDLVNAVQRGQLDKWDTALNTAVENGDEQGVVDALRGLTRATNSNVNANLRQTRLAQVLNGRATNGTPMADFVQQKLDAGEDIFNAPSPVSRPDRPKGVLDEVPDGVDPEVDKVDNAVSQAIQANDGSAVVMDGDQQRTDGYYVVDHTTLSEYDEQPTVEDITNFLDETDGSSFDGVSAWYDEDDGRYRMARVDVFDDEQDASDASKVNGSHQYVNIADGTVMNVTPGGDQNAPSEAVPDPRSPGRVDQPDAEPDTTPDTAPDVAPVPEPAAPDDGGTEALDVGGDATQTLDNLFERIGQPEDYGTEYQGRKLGEARGLAGEGLNDEAADALEAAAAQEPDGSENKRLMQEAADALRGETPETTDGEEPSAGGPEAPVPIPFGRTIPQGWSSPPGSSTVIRSDDDGHIVIANPDGTYTALRSDGTSGQFSTADEAIGFADGDDPDTTTSDEESLQAGLINPAHPAPADFSRSSDDTALAHVPSGDTITVEPDPDAEADKPYVTRDEDGAVQARSESLDEAMQAVDEDTDGGADDAQAETGTPLQGVLNTHITRDFSTDRHGNPAIDRKTGKPLSAHDARLAALRAAGKAQGKEWFGSGNFYAVVGTTSIKAKVISGDREGFELDPSETNLFASLADQIAQSQVPQSTKDRLAELTDPASLTGKRMFVDAKGGAIVAVDADGRVHGPFTGNNAALKGNHGDAAEQLTRKAVRGGGRYAWTADDSDAQLLAHVGLKGTHRLPDGSIAYQYDPERVGEKFDRTKLTTAPNVATALKDHDNWRQQYESNPFHIALDQGEMGDTHVHVDVPDIDPKTGQQKLDKDGNPLTRRKKGPWGAHGASGLIVRAVDPKTGEDRFLMVQRSNAIGNSGKWQFGGGAINSHETGEQGAAREFFEETKPPAGWLSKLSHVGTNTTTDTTFNWDYANVAADTPTMFDPTLDYESEKALWLTRQDIADLEANGDLLPAVGASIRDSLSLWGQTPQTVLPTPSGNAAARAKAISHMPKKGAKGPAGPAPEIPAPGAAPTPEPAAPDVPTPAEVPAAPRVEITEHGSINDPGASYDNFTAGSNQGQRWVVPLPDGTTERYFVKDFKGNPDAGRQEALASAFYRAMGLDAPEADFNEEENRLYSKWTDGLSSGSWTSQQKKEMRDGFAADAWLAAWDIRTGDNTVLTQDGKPFRLDNGGTMEYRAQGSKKGSGGTTAFGNTVGELDTFRNGQTQASQLYGTRGATPDAWEADSGQRVVDVSDEEIRSMVADYNLPDSLADTLIARKQDIASRYSLEPSLAVETNASAPNAMKGTPEEVLSQSAKDADHPAGTVASTEASSPASPAAVEAGTALPLTHDKASDETKWAEDKDRSSLLPVAKVGDAHTLTMSDGSTKDYAVYAPKTPDQGQRMQLASALYNETGIATPEVDYDAADNQVYTALTDLGPDRGTAGHPDVAAGFVMDAWLGNLRISPKNVAYAPDGTPIRADVRFALGGAKTPLDPHGAPATLDGLRNPGINAGAASIFGTRSGGYDDFEYDGAAEVVAIPDDRIRELVAAAGLDSSMADTLIARRDGIRDYYNLVDTSTPVLSKVSFRATNAAESLRDAKRGLSTDNKIEYVRSHMADGSSYTDVLKSNRGLENAFDALWRENNPDKPDSIFRGVTSSALGSPLQPVNNSGGSIATHSVRNINAQQVVALVKDFDTSQQTWDDAARDFRAAGSPGDDGQVALQLVQGQRGYQDANEEVSWSEFTKLVSSTHTHVFRGADDKTLTAIREGNWRGGTGGRAHGSGVYVSTDIHQSLMYAGGGWGSGHIADMAFEQSTANIADSQELRALASKLNSAIASDTSLTTEERRFLNALTGGGSGYWSGGDVGALAAFLGFDAVQGNNHYGSAYDFNILNKNRVVFHKHSRPFSTSQAHQSNLETGKSSTSGYGNGVRNPDLMDDLGRGTEPEEAAAGEGGADASGGAGAGGGGPTV
jgi:hypothetical protein